MSQFHMTWKDGKCLELETLMHELRTYLAYNWVQCVGKTVIHLCENPQCHNHGRSVG